MSTLSVTHDFLPGTLAKANEVDQNFTDVINWGNGNITDSNFDDFTGPLTWVIGGGYKAINISNSGAVGSVSITQSIGLNPTFSSFELIDTAIQTAGIAEMYLNMTSLSSTIPVFKADYAGSQVFAIKKDRLEIPNRTTVQRDAIVTPAEGSILYNSTNQSLEFKNASAWTSVGVPVGVMLPFAVASVPIGWLPCDGSEQPISTYPILAALLTTTWGAAAVGNFKLPDLRGRTAIGSGTGAGLTARTLADTTIGIETSPGHTHTIAHTHDLSNHTHSNGTLFAAINTLAGGTGIENANIPTAVWSRTHFISPLPATTASPAATATGTDIFGATDMPSSNSTGSSSAADTGASTDLVRTNMQPSAVVNYIIKW